MNQTMMITILLVAVLIIWIYMKNSRTSKELRIDPAQAKTRLDMEKGIILLDVRTQDEYIENHIPGSILIPLNTLAMEASKKLLDKKPLFLSIVEVEIGVGPLSRCYGSKVMNLFDLGGIIRWPYKTISGKK